MKFQNIPKPWGFGKFILKIQVFVRRFSPRSPEPGGNFENPPGAARHAREAGVRREAPSGGRTGGDFQNSRTGDGDLGEIPDEKPEF